MANFLRSAMADPTISGARRQAVPRTRDVEPDGVPRIFYATRAIPVL
ncbi:hypothetical protein WBO78_13455 [Bosea sp. CCNWLW174]